MLYEFPCGCRWPILEESPPADTIPLLDFNIELAPENCPAAWGLLGKGLTKGIFQLESSLGKQWTKKLKPENAEHITALGAILRPGCLRATDEEGVSATQHYCRRKNMEEEVVSYHPAVDAILFPTYNVMVYQEQAMAIAQAVAGFNLQEADVLRKAIGKKLPAEMAKVKTMFLEGAAKAGIISVAQAEDLFAQIEKSQRYSFNKSHSCCYGLTGYETAYLKAHHPIAFFTSWLFHAKNKSEPLQEINELVNDAKLFDIYVETPDLRQCEAHFSTDRKTIRFGLSDIKGIGEAQIAKVKDSIATIEQKLNKKVGDWTWNEFLMVASDNFSANVVSKLIQVGALRWMNIGRLLMSTEYETWSALTDKERSWICKNVNYAEGLIPSLKLLGRPKKEGGGCANKKRVASVQSHTQLLENPPTKIVDTPQWIAWSEEQLLGIAITCSRIDSCDISEVNTTCKDYLGGRSGFLMFGVEIQQVREIKTKRGKTPGQKMAFLTISDGSCALTDVVVFPEVWKEFGPVLVQGNTVILHGERDTKTKDSNTLIVKKAWQAVDG